MSDTGLIERIEVSEPSEGNVQYDIQFEGDRPNGFVSLNYSEFKHYITRDTFLEKNEEPSLEEIARWEGYNFFTDLGIKPDDVTVYLNQFKPNGDGLSRKDVKKYSRQGVGGFVFEKVLDDSLERGAKIMTTLAITRQMRGFAKKNCFTRIKGDRYYLML